MSLSLECRPLPRLSASAVLFFCWVRHAPTARAGRQEREGRHYASQRSLRGAERARSPTAVRATDRKTTRQTQRASERESLVA
ncbi:hypothetical protein PF004_g3316 [Phytophthora fragariae]|uniref:Uncharacterized protein n=1 Tax=Phytophthora fragariae TaxID=53985 RepID=A0A6G0PLZ1_9STRA|nr:hypothetical protein PF004_g3316 [Phytophthora fragariae]